MTKWTQQHFTISAKVGTEDARIIAEITDSKGNTPNAFDASEYSAARDNARLATAAPELRAMLLEALSDAQENLAWMLANGHITKTDAKVNQRFIGKGMKLISEVDGE